MNVLDYSVFPDIDAPLTLDSDADRADYIARICGAWDFGVVPLSETFQMLSEWRSVFDRFPLLDSPAYGAFRMLYGWQPLRGGRIPRADYEKLDERSGRPPDPWAERW